MAGRKRAGPGRKSTKVDTQNAVGTQKWCNGAPIGLCTESGAQEHF